MRAMAEMKAQNSPSTSSPMSITRTRRGRPRTAVSAVNGLSAFKHTNEIPDLSSSGLSFLHRANPIQDRISVSASERSEESCGLRVRIERSLQVRWDLSFASWSIRRLPSAICHRFINFQLPRRLHAPRQDQFQRAFPIFIRPLATRSARVKRTNQLSTSYLSS